MVCNKLVSLTRGWWYSAALLSQPAQLISIIITQIQPPYLMFDKNTTGFIFKSSCKIWLINKILFNLKLQLENTKYIQGKIKMRKKNSKKEKQKRKNIRIY